MNEPKAKVYQVVTGCDLEGNKRKSPVRKEAGDTLTTKEATAAEIEALLEMEAIKEGE